MQLIHLQKRYSYSYDNLLIAGAQGLGCMSMGAAGHRNTGFLFIINNFLIYFLKEKYHFLHMAFKISQISVYIFYACIMFIFSLDIDKLKLLVLCNVATMM